jgi:signal transduction histidine kinase
MSIRTLRWITVIAPTAFVVAFEFVTRLLVPHIVPGWGHVVAALAAISSAAFAFSTFVFTSVARLERQVNERNRRLAVLNSVAAHASESLDLEEVANAIARDLIEGLDADAAAVALVGEDDGELRLVGCAGQGLEMSVNYLLGADDCECRKVVALDRPLVIENAHEAPSCARVVTRGRPATCVSAPVRSKAKGIGALLVVRSGRRTFSKDEVDLVSALGSQVGPVLQNAQLFSNTGAIAMLQERQRVAREVHDGLAQTLGYLNVQMGIIDQLCGTGELDSVRTELQTMAVVTRDAYEDLRHSITDLRTPATFGGGVRRTLREYVERFSLQTGIRTHFEGHSGVPAVLSRESEAHLLRIVQEALNNVRKHAPGATVCVRVEADSRRVTVHIRDDGPGFDAGTVRQEQRYGLRTMSERAEASGGTLVIESQPGQGTTIGVMMPVQGLKAAS